MKKEFIWGFHGGAMDRNPPANAGDQGSQTIPGLGGLHKLQSS